MYIFDINGYREVNFDLEQSDINKLQEFWSAYVDNIPPYPRELKGQGIVMCAGGIKYFTCVWIAIRIIRDTGCKLPIELWYQGKELSKEVLFEIEKLNVKCRDLLQNGGMSLKSYAIKPLAIIKSSFQEVLFLDADNICLGNPEMLFKTKEYLNNGAVFWPDYWKTSKHNAIWKITNTQYAEEYEQESGQLLVNKRRSWTALNLCLHFNILNSIYYKLLMGDKDTFRFAWKALNQPYYMVKYGVSSCGYTDKSSNFYGTSMIQYDIDGEPLFVHRNLLKWDVTNANELMWKNIKQFKSDASKREYYYLYNERMGHYYIDIKGDVEECYQQLNMHDFRQIGM